MSPKNQAIKKVKKDELEGMMNKLKIFKSDLKERFIRSSGKGGQNVNKNSTCVYLKHIPTGIEVKCQKERTQSSNRFFARRILVKKIENLILGIESKEKKRIAKIRKQKRKRTKRAKEKILREKHIHSEKKQDRKKVFEIQ